VPLVGALDLERQLVQVEPGTTGRRQDGQGAEDDADQLIGLRDRQVERARRLEQRLPPWCGTSRTARWQPARRSRCPCERRPCAFTAVPQPSTCAVIVYGFPTPAGDSRSYRQDSWTWVAGRWRRQSPYVATEALHQVRDTSMREGRSDSSPEDHTTLPSLGTRGTLGCRQLVGGQEGHGSGHTQGGTRDS
jgi:hypothetical protein